MKTLIVIGVVLIFAAGYFAEALTDGPEPPCPLLPTCACVQEITGEIGPMNWQGRWMLPSRPLSEPASHDTTWVEGETSAPDLTEHNW